MGRSPCGWWYGPASTSRSSPNGPGFRTASRSSPECAAIPRVLRGRFRRDLPPGDPIFPSGLYWKLDYQADDGVVWTIDMWLLERGAPGGLDTTTRLRRLLTDDRRASVLAIKEAAAAQHRRVWGYLVCQAVIDDEVGTLEEFDRWVARREGSR